MAIIDKNQIKLLHTLKGALKLTDDQYRERIMNVHGFSNTCKDLTFDEADQLIKDLQEEAKGKGVWKEFSPQGGAGTPPLHPDDWDHGKKYEELGKRAGMASPKQLRMIEAMWKEVSFQRGRSREDALKSFVFRITGLQGMRFLDKWAAHAVIEAIKKMNQSRSLREESKR